MSYLMKNGEKTGRRGLYIVASDPISPHFRGGGSAIFYEQLASLAELGHEMHLWHYAYPDTRESFDRFNAGDGPTWKQVQQMCRSVHLHTFSPKQGLGDRVRNKVGALFGQNPLPRRAAALELRRLIDRVQPDFIWAQHFEPALIASAQREVPVIYSHHDWLYRIKALRFQRAENTTLRALEEKVTRQVAAVVSGSFVECAELRALKCPEVHYIPVGYDLAPWDPAARASDPARLVHLGGMGTTASRVGLERFFEVVWPQLAAPRPELVVVGDTLAAPPTLQELLKGVTCAGYVRELTEVLRPFDLHIIPWEHSTGQRTRLPVAFNYGQVVVAVAESVACFPEAKEAQNCRLVKRLDQMPTVIAELLHNPAERERLGRAARATFETSFTRPGLLPRYEAVLNSAIRPVISHAT
jgi:glycosyltransferase involved in cell wall biosynthesis